MNIVFLILILMILYKITTPPLNFWIEPKQPSWRSEKLLFCKINNYFKFNDASFLLNCNKNDKTENELEKIKYVPEKLLCI